MEIAPLDFSIIIPTRSLDSLCHKCIRICHQLYPKTELIVIVDNEEESPTNENLKILKARNKTIGAKRNQAAEIARGRYLAFIDSDAYPQENWLESAKESLQEASVVAVGGPNLPPPDQSYQESLSWSASLSFLISGPSAIERDSASQARFVQKLPSSNLIVDKQLYLKLGGMNAELYTGEDWEFCHRLIQYGGHIRFEPNVQVFHKNRGFLGFLRQRLVYGASVPALTRLAPSLRTSIMWAPAISLIVALSLVIWSWQQANIYWLLVPACMYLSLAAIESLRLKGGNQSPVDLFAVIVLGNLAPGVGTFGRLTGLIKNPYRIYHNQE